MPNTPFFHKQSLYIPVLIAVCLILFFFNLGDRALWDIDEGKHSVTSKNMVLGGDWLTPEFDGKKFYDKPPLHNWFVAISFVVFGFTEFAARLPAALLGLGSVILTYILGRQFYKPAAAFIGSLVLATCIEYIVLSRTVVHDISLLFFFTLALTCFYLGYDRDRHRKLFFLSGYAAMGLAVMAKGPIGVLIPVAIVGLFLLMKKRLNFISKLQIGWGLLILLGIAAPWYILISLKDPNYAGYFFIQQNIGNFLSKDPRHLEPVYFYLPVLLGGMAPWSLFLPLALLRGIRSSSTPSNDGTLFLLIWFVFVFVFFTLASSKLGTYILPLFPAAALLIGQLLYGSFERAKQAADRGIVYSYLPLVIGLVLALAYVLVFPPAELAAEGGLELVRIYWITGVAVACSIISLVLIIKRNNRLFIASMVVTVTGVFLLALIYLVPQIEPYRSGKVLARQIDQMLDPAEKIVFYDRAGETFLFYTNRRVTVLETPRELEDYLASEKQVYFIIRMKNWKEIEMLHDILHVVAQRGNQKIVSNRKPPV